MRMRGLLFCLLLPLAALRAGSVDCLVAAATDAELQPLIARLQEPRTETRAGWTFWLGQLNGRAVVLTRTEGDPLNAVAAVTLGIRRYNPRLVLTYGSARAHDPALQPGDALASRSFAAFDGIISAVTPLAGGSDALKWERLPHAPMHRGEQEKYTTEFPADAAALAAALTLNGPKGKVKSAVLGSAPQVNLEADRIAWIRSTWGTDSEDLESAHIAGCAELLGVPALGLRIINGSPAESAALALRFLEARP